MTELSTPFLANVTEQYFQSDINTSLYSYFTFTQESWPHKLSFLLLIFSAAKKGTSTREGMRFPFFL